VQEALPEARAVAVKLATGGLFVIVSVIGGPATMPGRTLGIGEALSVNFVLEISILKSRFVAGLITSNATLARRFPLTVPLATGAMLTGLPVRKVK